MSMFKRCGTAMALVLASSVPVLAQDSDDATLVLPEGFVAPEGSVVVQFAGTDTLFVAPYGTAAELCQVTEGDFAAIAESSVDVIYCEQLDEANLATFTETEGVETLIDREAGDDDDELESVAGDDAGEGVEGDDAGGDDSSDDDASGDDGSDSVEGDDGTDDGATDDDDGMDDGAAEGEAGDDMDDQVGEDSGTDNGASADVEADADASVDAGTND
jgi:hypothetical protein